MSSLCGPFCVFWKCWATVLTAVWVFIFVRPMWLVFWATSEFSDFNLQCGQGFIEFCLFVFDWGKWRPVDCLIIKGCPFRCWQLWGLWCFWDCSCVFCGGLGRGCGRLWGWWTPCLGSVGGSAVGSFLVHFVCSATWSRLLFWFCLSFLTCVWSCFWKWLVLLLYSIKQWTASLLVVGVLGCVCERLHLSFTSAVWGWVEWLSFWVGVIVESLFHGF